MKFAASCPKCGTRVRARTMVGVRLAAREHRERCDAAIKRKAEAAAACQCFGPMFYGGGHACGCPAGAAAEGRSR